MNTRSITGLREVAEHYRAFYVDQFGVMHDGKRPLPGAIEALTQLTRRGKRVIILTNSGKRAVDNVARVLAFGFPPESFSALVSSGEVAHTAIRTGSLGAPFRARSRVYVVGRTGDDYGLDDLGLRFAADAAQADMLLIMGSDCPRASLDDYRRLLAGAAAKGIPALCCNPDIMMVTPTGRHPAPGAIARVYAALGGKVTYVGKPGPAIYHAAADLADAEQRQTLAIGDSLDHDVLGAAQFGIDTLLLRGGVLADLSAADFAAALAAASFAPTFIADALRW